MLIRIVERFLELENGHLLYFYALLECILTSALYSLTHVLDKYYILTKHIKPIEIIFYQGLFELVFSIIALIITTKYGLGDNFYDYREQLDKKEVIFLILLIIFNFFYYSLVIFIIDIFSPFYIFSIYLISSILNYFIDLINNVINIDDLEILFFIGNIFCLFIVLIFFEIIELNCFGLSKMTKKNIQLRAQLDSILEDNDDDGEENDEHNVLLPLEDNTQTEKE